MSTHEIPPGGGTKSQCPIIMSGPDTSPRDRMRWTENIFPVQVGPGPAGDGQLGEFLASTSIIQIQRYPATKLHFQTALQGYKAIFLVFNDFFMPFHSWALSSF